MNYFISFMHKEGDEWCVFFTTDEEYAYKVFEDLCPPPNWNMELRCTKEDIETYLDYEVLRYDHREF